MVALTVRISPEGPEAKLVTAITSRSTPREGSFGFLVAVSISVALGLAGVAILLLAGLLLRSVGPGLRIGRLLGGTTLVPIDEAVAIATTNAPRYVRVSGRISSDEEFPDDQNRPLVFRRTRLEILGTDRVWTTVLDEREAVRFGVETRSAYIAVDDVALGDGLVVIPRVSAGTVADLPSDFGADIPAGTPAGTPARLTIEQVSAVEQATVVGRPLLNRGTPTMSSGDGRPLVVTTLDQSAAMRVLAGGKRRRVVVGAVSLGIGLGFFAGAVAAFLIGA